MKKEYIEYSWRLSSITLGMNVAAPEGTPHAAIQGPLNTKNIPVRRASERPWCGSPS
jgi:hypothetical protein